MTPLRSLGQVTLPSAAASLALVYAAAQMRNRWLFVFAAFLFCATAVVEAYRFNRHLWRAGAARTEPELTPAAALHHTSIYSVFVYAWGAAAMYISYPIAGLPWQHGWEYGLAMALVAVLMAQYLTLLGQGQPSVAGDKAVLRAVQLAAFQGLAMGAGVLALVFSGKLTAPKVDWKADWAANIVFAAGGSSLIILSALIVRSHIALTRRQK